MTSSRKYKGVIFDCDGVLINSENIIEKALAKELEGHNVTIDSSDYARHFVGREPEQRLKKLSEIFNEQTGQALPADFMDKCVERYLEMEANFLTFTEGVLPIISALQREAIPYAIASNSHADSLERKLKSSGLDMFFAHVYSAYDCENLKPAPDIYLHAADELGVDPAQAIMIDDSVTGIQAAKAAGGYVIAFTGCYDEPLCDRAYKAAGADEVISDMKTLCERLGELLNPEDPKSTPSPSP